MKVIGFNASARKKGNTACSMNTVFAELEKAGIEAEMILVDYINYSEMISSQENPFTKFQ